MNIGCVEFDRETTTLSCDHVMRGVGWDDEMTSDANRDHVLGLVLEHESDLALGHDQPSPHSRRYPMSTT